MPSSSILIASPPIFISPSSLDQPFSPSPSPLPAAAGSPPNSVPTAAIVGGSVAGVVAVAATATIIAAVAGKVGLGSCLLGPLCNLLSFLASKIFGPCAKRLDCLCNALDKCNPARKRRRSDKAADDDDESRVGGDGDVLYEILGGSPTRATKEEYTVAAAYSLTKSPLQDVIEDHVEQLQTSAHTYLVTSVSDFAESELKKHTEMILQPLNEDIEKAQSYAEAFFSAADDVNDTLTSLKQSSDAILDEASKLDATVEDGKQLTDTTLSIFGEAIQVEAEKLKNTTANENAAGAKRQGAVLVEEERVLPKRQGKPPTIASSGDADESEEEEVQQGVLGGRRSGQVYIVQSASDAHTEIQLQDMGSPSYKHEMSRAESASNACTELQLQEMGNPSHKHETSGAASSRTTHRMAVIPTDTGSTKTNSAATGTMVPVHGKELIPTMQGSAMTSKGKGKRTQVDLKKVERTKRKRPRNLGHVSLSFEVSAHRLRCFTSCRTGGTYGSPPSSPDNVIYNKNFNQYYHDHNVANKASDDYYGSGQPHAGDHYHTPLYNASHHDLMHQQYHPSQSILVQYNPVTSKHTTPLPPLVKALDSKPPLHRSSIKPSINDYGDAFDGVL